MEEAPDTVSMLDNICPLDGDIPNFLTIVVQLTGSWLILQRTPSQPTLLKML
jgi:hypothetical protein